MVPVIVLLKTGLLMDYAMERIRHMELIFAAMILMVAIAPKQNVVILPVVMVPVMVMKLKQIVLKTVRQVQNAMNVNLISRIMAVNVVIVHGMSLV
jgi:hypothetical protein